MSRMQRQQTTTAGLYPDGVFVKEIPGHVWTWWPYQNSFQVPKNTLTLEKYRNVVYAPNWTPVLFDYTGHPDDVPFHPLILTQPLFD